MKPLPPQIEISDRAKRFNVIVTGRRVGKSEATHSVLRKGVSIELPLIMPAVRYGKPMGIFSQDFKDTQQMWNAMTTMFEPIIQHADNTKHTILFHGGGTIDFFSLLNISKKYSGRGRKFARIIVEEAQKINDELFKYWWNETARPTLMDYRGDAFFIANPNGQGTFLHNLARRGGNNEDDLPQITGDWKNWQSLRFSTYDNPRIDRAEIEETRNELDELSFQQEIMGRFVNYAGEIWCYVMKELAVQNKVLVTGLTVNRALPLIFSFDFNKRPMTAIAMQFPQILFESKIQAETLSKMIKSGIHAIKEFCTDIATDASIYDTCRLIREYVYEVYGVKIGKWPNGYFHNTLPIFVTGDASGNTGDGRQSDPTTYYEIICSELGLQQLANVRILSSNPHHSESYVKVNSNLANNPNCKIDREKCPKLVKDIFGVKSDKFRGIDKTDASKSHLLDCLRYGIHNFA